MDRPEKVNLTAEEEVEDDDVPDLSALQLNTEIAHLFMNHANGTTHFDLVHPVA